MIALGFLLVGIGFGAHRAATTLPALPGTVAIWTLGEMIGAPVAYAYVADIAPPSTCGGATRACTGWPGGRAGSPGRPSAGALLPEAAAVFWPLWRASAWPRPALVLVSPAAEVTGPPSVEPQAATARSRKVSGRRPYPAGDVSAPPAG